MLICIHIIANNSGFKHEILIIFSLNYQDFQCACDALEQENFSLSENGKNQDFLKNFLSNGSKKFEFLIHSCKHWKIHLERLSEISTLKPQNKEEKYV